MLRERERTPSSFVVHSWLYTRSSGPETVTETWDIVAIVAGSRFALDHCTIVLDGTSSRRLRFWKEWSHAVVGNDDNIVDFEMEYNKSLVSIPMHT